MMGNEKKYTLDEGQIRGLFRKINKGDYLLSKGDFIKRIANIECNEEGGVLKMRVSLNPKGLKRKRKLFEKEVLLCSNNQSKKAAMYAIGQEEGLLWCIDQNLMDKELISRYERKIVRKYYLSFFSTRRISNLAQCYNSIPDELKTYGLSYILMKDNSAYISLIPESLKSRELCDMFDIDLYNLRNTTEVEEKMFVRYLRRNQEVVHIAVEQIIHLINNDNIDLIFDYVKVGIGKHLISILKDNQCFKEEHLIKIINKDKNISIEDIPSDIISQEVCEIIFKNSPTEIFSIDEEYISDSILRTFVQASSEDDIDELKQMRPNLYKRIKELGYYRY